MGLLGAARRIATSHVGFGHVDERKSRLIFEGWRNDRKGVKERVKVVTGSNRGGRGSPSNSGQLSSQEYFESFFRRRQADGDFVSKATDLIWKREVLELDEETRLRVQEKILKLQKMKEVEDNGNYLHLTQARNWSLGQDVAPVNLNTAAVEREMAREDRKQQGLLEYEALKRELLVMTAGVSVAVGAYCFIILSLEATLSYGIGALASLGYLKLLYRHVDEVGKDNVAQIFVQRRRKRIGITSMDLQESVQKLVWGSSRALSSPRLVIPAALYGVWAFTTHFAEKSPIHLEIAPLLFGFFAYKGAAIAQTFRDNKDLLFSFPDSKWPGNF